MDRRGWPWKKKSSDKTEKIAIVSDSAGASVGSQVEQDNPKKVNYVQLSVESYTHLTGLEDQIKMMEDQAKVMEDQIKVLNEKLSSAQSEMTTKDNLVKQHAKVAEEAVSGWEKAEAEALALKHQLESVTLLKLTAEDKATHLDGALKECMRQIRNLKEEHEQKLHEVVLTKTKLWDKIKHDLETKISDLEQELLRSSAENAAISRSLQERSNMLMKISEEKSQAEAEIELLNANIQSCEKEISSLKYELHIVSKELEIRNEEKNMSVRSAEVANKQHLEGVKKIAKLEAECQRLRGLVRKKLPGPAALAKMKMEVENLGRDHGETRLRRSPAKSPSQLSEFSLDNVHQSHKETEFLTARLLAMEEETKMLKEALAKRNSELQDSRNMYAKTASRLRSLEVQMQMAYQPKSNAEMPTECSSSQNASTPPSLTSMSEDGLDEDASCAESWATALISELSHFKKERNVDKTNKAENTNHLELMDDFLEMERLACLSTESNGSISVSNGLTDKIAENTEVNALVDSVKGGDITAEQHTGFDPSGDPVSSNVELSAPEVEPTATQVPFSKLQSRILMILESQDKDANVEKILEGIKHVVQDIQDTLSQQSLSSTLPESLSADSICNKEVSPQDIGESMESEISLTEEKEPGQDNENAIDQELVIAISHIHDFVTSLGKEAMGLQGPSPDGQGLCQKIEDFSSSVNKVLCNKMSLVNFVLHLSHVLAKASELSFNVLGYKGSEGENNSSDCIDKVTLLENKVIQDDTVKERILSGCTHIPHSTSDPEILQEESFGPGFGLSSTSCKCTFEELEQLKLENDNMRRDLQRCTENLEHTKFQLQETEQLLAELKSQLASSQKMNSLADTQLKCMAESYKSLETRAGDLEAEVIFLRAKAENLDNELQQEKRNHHDALVKCKDLEEQLQRSDNCSKCSSTSAVDIDLKTKQEREIAAAAEKLAECQETIFLLGRQLKALRPPVEFAGSPYNEMHQMDEGFMEDEPRSSFSNPQGMGISQDLDQAEMGTSVSNMNRMGGESPSETFNSILGSSDTEVNLLLRSPVNSKHPKHSHNSSVSSSSSSTPTPEKHSRGFSRFFSSKQKNTH